MFDSYTCVLQFIERVEVLCLSRDILFNCLFMSAVELFVDDALYWFRGVRNEVNSWEQLKALLIEE